MAMIIESKVSLYAAGTLFGGLISSALPLLMTNLSDLWGNNGFILGCAIVSATCGVLYHLDKHPNHSRSTFVSFAVLSFFVPFIALQFILYVMPHWGSLSAGLMFVVGLFGFNAIVTVLEKGGDGIGYLWKVLIDSVGGALKRFFGVKSE